MVATLTIGLPSESRVKRYISKTKWTSVELMLAMIVDKLSILIWQRTADGHKNRNRPESLYTKLIGTDKKDELEKFRTPEEFERWRESKARKQSWQR